MQFLAIVSNEKRFGFRERPMNAHTGHEMLTDFAECLYFVCDLHRLS